MGIPSFKISDFIMDQIYFKRRENVQRCQLSTELTTFNSENNVIHCILYMMYVHLYFTCKMGVKYIPMLYQSNLCVSAAIILFEVKYFSSFVAVKLAKKSEGNHLLMYVSPSFIFTTICKQMIALTFFCQCYCNERWKVL